MKTDFVNWEEKEQQYYNQYDRFFYDCKNEVDSMFNATRVSHAFKLNIGCCFFYFVFTSRKKWDNLIYREGTFDINKYRNTYLYDLVYRMKLNNLYLCDEFDYIGDTSWRKLNDDYYNNGIYSDYFEFCKIKSFESFIEYSDMLRILTLKAIPSYIVQPLILPKEDFVFSKKEIFYMDILKETTGLFFLRNWNCNSQIREYYFLSSEKYGTNTLLQILNERYNYGILNIDKLNEREIASLDEMKIYRFMFNNNRCIVENYNWGNYYSLDSDSKSYKLIKKNDDIIECSNYFESYIAGCLIFNMQTFHEDKMCLDGIITKVIDESINGVDTDSSYKLMSIDSPINPWHFNLYLDKKYFICSHLKEIADRHSLYYSLKSRIHQKEYQTLSYFLHSCNKQNLESISDNTFINLTNFEISNILYGYIKSNKKLIDKIRHSPSDTCMHYLYETILYPNLIEFEYEYNEYSDNEYASPEKCKSKDAYHGYDLNRSFRNELIHRVFYDDRCGYRFE